MLPPKHGQQLLFLPRRAVAESHHLLDPQEHERSSTERALALEVAVP